ncbi:uncharacterized protein [Chelonus insularis]|uniref:uncharacterized protein isoform X1 n=1 Tax=Chelonus insularis TaxID=460826 RepID=UPI00158A1EB7|nr:uncharacterized protein LOC118063848 isoform X1 [Chelonus insularis]
MFILISTFLLCSQFLISKADLEVILLDFKFEYYDLDYFKDMDSDVWGNEIFINVTITNFLPEEAELRLQVIGATMGEYIVPTGIDFLYSLCAGLKEPNIMTSAINYLEPPLDDCPPKPGSYVADATFDDFSTFPENFPPNNYFVNTTVFTPEKIFLEMHAYVSTR